MLNVAHVKNDVKWRPIVTKLRGQDQNEVHIAHLHCSLSWLVSSLEISRLSSFGGEANTNYYPSNI